MNIPHGTSERDDELQQMLAQWAAQRGPSNEQLTRLESRIATAIDEKLRAGAAPAAKRMSGAVGGLAIVLVVLVAFALSFRGMPISGGRSSHGKIADAASATATKLAEFDESLVKGQSALRAELDAMFPGQWHWVTESRNQVRLEVGERRHASDEALAVRITIARRLSGEIDWQSLYTVDCLARREEVVELHPVTDGMRGSVVFWAYPIADDLVAIDSSVIWEHSGGGDQQRIVASFSGVQSASVPLQISSTQTTGAEYQIFQTVATMSEESL